MKHETELKIQAHLDGELSPTDAQQITELIRRDTEARALYESLTATRTILKENEPQLALPESREFYWSKIERAIRRPALAEEQAPRLAAGWNRWWMRFVVPLAGAAMLLAVILMGPRLGTSLSSNQDWQGVELPFEESSSITFHSDAENMTVVWVKAR